jgi:hypothetical protein
VAWLIQIHVSLYFAHLLSTPSSEYTRCAVLPALRLTDVNEPGRSFPVIKNNRKTEGKKRTTQSTTKRFGGQVQF